MLYILSFLLSWLCGMLTILITAFFTYDHFSIIDITSFAVITFVGYLILFLVLYLPAVNISSKKIEIQTRFLYLPMILILIANLPAYFFIWKNTGDLYEFTEAILFVISLIASSLVFGSIIAWKNNRVYKS